MADSTCLPSPTDSYYEVWNKLDALFADFWHKLEGRMWILASPQPNSHLPRMPLPNRSRAQRALLSKRASSRWKTKRRTPPQNRTHKLLVRLHQGPQTLWRDLTRQIHTPHLTVPGSRGLKNLTTLQLLTPQADQFHLTAIRSRGSLCITMLQECKVPLAGIG
ncbi:Hypothetical predicted protein [Pelobates cultripes]|uniref:Uncharacterized protein n=1 Tax=Pelobates cultripes TaxID=61616 RepID=A0AAD1RHY4_PELCU|nr:Hypothetical predicted protein [Pelobates cultripes]